RVLSDLRSRRLGEIVLLDTRVDLPLDADDSSSGSGVEPSAALRTLSQVHSEAYIRFVQNIFSEFQREIELAGEPELGYALAYTLDRLGRDETRLGRVVPTNASGKLGYYSYDTG